MKKVPKSLLSLLSLNMRQLQLQKTLNEEGTKIEKDDNFENMSKQKVTKLEDQTDTRKTKLVLTKDIMVQEIQDVEKYVHMSPLQKKFMFNVEIIKQDGKQHVKHGYEEKELLNGDHNCKKAKKDKKHVKNRQRALALPTIVLMFVASSIIPQFNLTMDATHTQDVDRSHVSLVQKLMEERDVAFKIIRNDANDLYA